VTALKIVCSGYLIRYPLGGFSWHHLQYLVGLERLGHEVSYFEDYGWPNSCFDPARNDTTADPSYGITYLLSMLQPYDLYDRWSYLAEDGTAHGMSRERLSQLCSECDVYLNLSGINWIPELTQCRRRVLVDTDPVFTQIGGHGLGGAFHRYHRLFTYAENVHRPGCDMPTGGARWLPTRQPVVLDLWPVQAGDPGAPFTTVVNWSAYGDREHEGRVYGQKDREFEPYFSLPRDTDESMEMTANVPAPVRERLLDGGWTLADPLEITRDPWTYQRYLRASLAEFGVAKHGYVSTRCGWFSDRSSAYLATGRPVIVQDTGFSAFLPHGEGLLAYRTPDEAVAAIRRLRDDEYDTHCSAARAVAEEYFDARRVLNDLLERSL
jgi:hypothetical protein